MLFDEATSSLDTASDAALQSKLVALCAGKTTVTIAHRLQTVMGMGRLIVLDAGRVIESGAPAALARAMLHRKGCERYDE